MIITKFEITEYGSEQLLIIELEEYGMANVWV